MNEQQQKMHLKKGQKHGRGNDRALGKDDVKQQKNEHQKDKDIFLL